MTASDSRHLSVLIDRDASEVYDFAADPANLPAWASGLATGVWQENGLWVADSPLGRIVIQFTERNALGVLDHYVTVADGERFYNPMRVLPADGGCEVVFTLRRGPGVDDAAFAADAATIEADLAALKGIMEA